MLQERLTTGDKFVNHSKLLSAHSFQVASPVEDDIDGRRCSRCSHRRSDPDCGLEILLHNLFHCSMLLLQGTICRLWP